MNPMPAVSLAAVPGRRNQTLHLATQIEAAGFAGIYCPSFGDNLSLCAALALVTKDIPFGTSITPIYTRNVQDFAQQISFIHEMSLGRFRFGIGVSHEAAMARLGIKNQGKPLADTRQFVADLKAVPRAGDLPPLVLATLRQKMIALSAEIADGMVFANAARSHMQASLSALPEGKQEDENFFIGNMIPTVISDDESAAMAVHRKTLTSYVMLPNYRNYWKEAGYQEEMAAIDTAIAAGDKNKVPGLLSDKWLADITLAGTGSRVREGVEAWFDAGVRTPILVPSSTAGGQMKAFEDLLAAFS